MRPCINTWGFEGISLLAFEYVVEAFLGLPELSIRDERPRLAEYH